MPRGRPSPRPAGSRGAGRAAGRPTTGRSATRSAGPGSRPAPRPPRRAGRRGPGQGLRALRPRLTGRAAVLVLVMAVLVVSYASSLRAYLQQQGELAGLRADIATSRAHITALEREQRRWQDPAYVRAQARQRFGWVLPGEVGFRVLGAHGTAMGADSSLDRAPVASSTGPTWYHTAWASVLAAGQPAKHRKPTPATEIRPPQRRSH